MGGKRVGEEYGAKRGCDCMCDGMVGYWGRSAVERTIVARVQQCENESH